MAEASGKTGFRKKGKLAECKRHKKQLLYWLLKSKELYCPTCILGANVNTSSLKLISDVIPSLKVDLHRARAVKKGLTRDLVNHKEEREKAVQELANLDTFEKSLLKLKTDYRQFIANVDSHDSKLREQWTSVNKIEERISLMLSEENNKIDLSYKETLEELHKTFACNRQERNVFKRDSEGTIKSNRIKGTTSEASSNKHQPQRMMRPAKLLSDIACVFEEGEGQEAVFIKKLQLETKRRKKNS